MNKILLHTCCAPCVLPVLEYFKEKGMISDVTLFFFNPNIFPLEEYTKRLEGVKQVGEIYNIPIIDGLYEHEIWLKYLEKTLDKDLKEYLENQERCNQCFLFRLERSVAYAKDHGFSHFASTLQVNLYKNTEFIIKEGERLCQESGLEFTKLSLDMKEAHDKERELCKEFDIYRQRFCGCEFSRNML